MATKKAGKEALQIAQFLAILEYKLLDQPVSLKANNKKTILPTANLEFHWHIKHIEVQHHQIWKKVQSKKIAIIYISTKDMVADRLTKILDAKLFKAF